MLLRSSCVLATLVACGPATSTMTLVETTSPATGTPPPATVTTSESVPLGRLPRDVRPTGYKLALEVAPDADGFRGTVVIAVHLDRPRDLVWLHAQHLEIIGASVKRSGQPPMPARWEQVKEGIGALHFDAPVGPGDAELVIAYTSSYDQELVGLYHVTSGGRKYAFTQLEATYARRVFPSFDEPSFKAPFELALTIPAGDRAISNTPIVDDGKPVGPARTVRFRRTTPLPTYLLAFAVGPFDIVDGPTLPPSKLRPRPVPIRGVVAAGRGAELKWALENAAPTLAALEEYFQIAFPYEKLDLIAVPDFEAGAMENPGAITFREYLLLVDGPRAPVGLRRWFFSVMAHEMAHQWFGDLVTMPWWDDVWLNESFATWMAMRVLQGIRPGDEYDVWELDHVHHTMGVDGLDSARQIRQPILTNDDIHNAFDSITYDKGGAVLQMFEHWIGREVFRRGVHRYLERHRFGNATADDLLAALSEEAGRDVGTPLRTFLLQPGVPLVRARTVCDGEGARLELEQSRHVPVGSRAEQRRTWQVPVCARYSIGGIGGKVADSCVLLTEATGRLPLPACPDWIHPNVDGTGYYRWSLAAADLRKLTAGYRQLSVLERVSLGANLRAALDSGAMPAADVLAALEPLARDEHHAVSAEPMEILKEARTRLVDPPLRPDLEAYARNLYRPSYVRLGWTGGPGGVGGDGAKLDREHTIFFLAFTARDPEVRREAARRGQAYLGLGPGGDGKIHEDAVEPELLDVALGVAVQEGGAPVYDAVLAHFERATAPLQRVRLLRSLFRSTTPALAERALALSLDPRLRMNERLQALEPQFLQVETRDAAFRWLETHLEALSRLVPQTHLWRLPGLIYSFCDEQHADDARRTFAPHLEKLDGAPRALAEAVESMRLCVARAAAQSASAATFFRKARTPPAPSTPATKPTPKPTKPKHANP